MTFPSHETGKPLKVDETGALAVPIADQLAAHYLHLRDGHLAKANALYQPVPAKRARPVLQYVQRYFDYRPGARQAESIQCDKPGCSEMFVPVRSTARYCPKHRRGRKHRRK